MVSNRFSRRLKRPAAFALTLAMILSAFAGGGFGLASAAAATGDIPEGSVYVLYGDPTESVGMSAESPDEGGFQGTVTYVVDRFAMKFPPGAMGGDDRGYIYCRTGAEFAAGLDSADANTKGPITVSIDYYDDPALSGGQFELWYNNGAGNAWSPRTTLSGTGTWKTANLVLEKIAIGGINNANDFRITSKTGGLAISRIIVSKGQVTINPSDPDDIPMEASYTVGVDQNSGVSSLMYFGGFMENEGVIGTFGTVDGRNVYTTQAGADGWRYMWFRVADGFREIPAKTMTLAITYYDAASAAGSSFNVWYAGDGSQLNSAGVTLAGSNRWKTAYITLPGSKIRGGLTHGQDFRLTVTNTVGTGVSFQKLEFFAYEKAAPEDPEEPHITPDPVSVTFTNPILEQGLFFQGSNDGGETPGGLSDVNGMPAWVVSSSVGDGGWVGQLRFKSDAVFSGNAGRKLTAVVEYYDDPAMIGGSFEICYNGGTYTPGTAIQGSGLWKTAYIALDNVNFGGMSGGGHDFWIIVKKNGMAFHKVTLYDGEVLPPVQGECYVTFGATQAETASENLYWMGNDDYGGNFGTFSTVAGQSAYTTGAPTTGWQYIWGRMERGFQTGSTVTLYITYYDGPSGQWNVWYRDASGTDRWSNTVNLGNTGQWKTEEILLRNVDFNSVTINNGNTFRFTVMSGQVSVHKIELVNGGGGEFGDAVYVRWGNNTAEASGIRWWTGDWGDGGNYASAGSPVQWGYQINGTGKNDIYVYLDVDDAYMYGGKNKAEISVEYWDGASGSFGFAYDSVDTPWTYPDGVSLRGTNQWVTKTFVFDDMAMSGRENGGADMRFEARGGVIVRSIAVRKIETVILEAAATKDASLFFDTDEVKFNLKITNQTSSAQTLSMAIDVVNPNGASVYSATQIVSASAKQVVNYPLSMGYDLPKGSYFLNINIRNAGGSINITERYRFGIIKDISGKEFTFLGWGACAHYGQGQGLLDVVKKLYKQAGVTSVRDEYYWGSVETSPGVYNINTNNWVKTLHDEGIRPLLILCYGNGLYGGSQYDSQAWLTAYSNYAEAMARAYKGVVDCFEVWNEFNGSFGNGRSDSYYGLLKAAYEGVKRGNPDAMIVAGGVVGYDDAFIKRVAAMGLPGQEGWRYMEAVSYHYPNRDQVTKCAQDLKDAIVQISGGQYEAVMGKPYPEMWITEIGWSTKVPGGETEAQQASYIAQLYTELAYNYDKSGATEMTHYYDFRNDGTNPAEHEQNFGFVDVTGAPKPSFVALNNLADLINGRTPGGRWVNVSGRSNLNITEFKGAGGDDDVYVVWSRVGEQSCSLNLGTNDFQVIDSYGNVVPYAIYNGSINITVGELPICVKGNFTTAPTAGDATFTSAQSVVYVTPGEEVSFRINRSGPAAGYSGYYEVQMPMGWSVVGGTAFGPGSQDTITILVGSGYTAQVGAIVVVAKSAANETYATVNISTSTVDAFEVEVYPVAKASGDGWDVAVKLNNNYNVATIPSGLFRVSSPVQSSGVYLFDEIPPQSSKVIMVPAPWLSGDFTRQFDFTITAGAGANTIVKNVSRKLSALTAVKSGGVTVDGSITAGEWNGAMTFTLDTRDTYRHVTGRDWQGPDDLSFVGKTKWDDDYLYVSVEVTDDVHNNTNSPGTWWMGDGVQLCIDPYRSFNSHANTGFEFFGFALSSASPGTTSYAESNSVTGAAPGEGLLSAVTRDETNHKTYYEMAFKWSSILPPSVYANFAPGYTDIGFSLLVNDNDGNERTGWQQYMDGIGFGRNPAQWGDLILTDLTSFDAPTPPNPDDPASWVAPPKPNPPYVPIDQVSALYATPNYGGENHTVSTLFDRQTRFTYYWTEYVRPTFIVFDLGKEYDVDEIWYRTQWDYDGGRINRYSVYSTNSPDGFGVLSDVNFSRDSDVNIHSILGSIPGLQLVVNNASAPVTVYDDYLLTGQTIGEYRIQFPDGAHAKGRYLVLVADETRYDDWRMATIDFHYIAPEGPVLDRIEVTTPPDKAAYTFGVDYAGLSDVDLTGIEVTAHYSDAEGGFSETVDIGDLEVLGVAVSQDSQFARIVTIGYEGKTATFLITVNDMPAPAVTGITITRNPSKLVYGSADAVDMTGLVVAVSYDYDPNGSLPATVGPNDVTIVSETRVGASFIYNVEIAYAGKTAVFQITRNPAVDSVVITAPPSTVVYYKGETVSLAGIAAAANLDNGDVRSLTASDLTVVSEVLTGGAYNEATVTVSYQGKTASFTITRPSLAGITVVTPPTNLAYYHGEAVSLAGISVSALYEDAHTEALGAGNVTVISETAGAGYDFTVTIGFMGMTAQFTITRPVIAGIAVTTLPNKVSYLNTQPIDLTGIAVTVTYSDGHTETVGANSLTYEGKAQIGATDQYEVTVGYQGFTATFEVTVTEEIRTIYMPFFELTQASGAITLPGDYFPGVRVWSDGYAANTMGPVEYQQGYMSLMGNNNGMSHNFLVTSPSFLGQTSVWLKIEYFDLAANTNNWFNYPNGSDRGNEGNQKALRFTGSGEWVSTVYHFTNARFGEALFGGTRDMTISLRRLPIKCITISIDPIATDNLGFEITAPPAKLTYQANEALDLTGLAAKVIDNSEAGFFTVGKNDVTVESVTRVGDTDEYVVTLSYAGFTDSFSITRSSEARAFLTFKDAAAYLGRGSVAVPTSVFSAANGILMNGQWLSNQVPNGRYLDLQTIAGSIAFVSEEAETRFDAYASDPRFIGAPTVYVKYIYFDSGQAGLRASRTIDATWANKDGFNFGGTGKWTSHTFTVSPARFGEKALEGSDLFIYGYNHLALKKIIFSLTPPGKDFLTLDITPPDVTDYYIGDALDLTGLTVAALYDDGSREVLPANAYTLTYDTDFSAAKGTKKVWIEYDDTKLSFDVEVTVDKRELAALIALADRKIENGDFDSCTAASMEALQRALRAAKTVNGDEDATKAQVESATAALQAALDAMETDLATFTCSVKSMLAKVGKLQQIPFTWDGAGALVFSTSNAAVCNVTQDGLLVPMKAGIAVITITLPDQTKYIFAVTVSV